MIPQFLQPSKAVDVPPPPGFQPAISVEWARLDSNVYSLPSKGHTFAQQVGVRYERKVQEFLEARFEDDYKNNPWFSFRDSSGARRCRPDGLLLFQTLEGVELAVIFEIKIRHMPDAWWQLRKLYMPVVSRAFPKREVRVLEIVKEFDPGMPFPEKPLLVDRVDEIWLKETFPEFGVFLWTR